MKPFENNRFKGIKKIKTTIHYIVVNLTTKCITIRYIVVYYNTL